MSKNHENKAAFTAVPSEMMELAARVRAILDTYPPNDPAVWQIRHSETYRRLAHLIEAPLVPWKM